MENQENITIQKAKLKEGLHLEVTYSEQLNDGFATHSQECTADAHDDLRAAFKALSVHVAALTFQYEKDGVLTKNIECRGFSVKGDDEDGGVTLTGIRTLPNGTVIVLNSPYLKFNNGEKYPEVPELILDLENCKKEVFAYLFNDKRAPNAQLDLFDQKPDSDIEQDPGKKKTEQEEMDEQDPVHISQMSIPKLKALGTTEATEELQRRNAAKNKKK